jgi:hypothetical protein
LIELSADRQSLRQRQRIKGALELDPRLSPKQWRGLWQQRSGLCVRLGLLGARFVYHYEVVTRGDRNGYSSLPTAGLQEFPKEASLLNEGRPPDGTQTGRDCGEASGWGRRGSPLDGSFSVEALNPWPREAPVLSSLSKAAPEILDFIRKAKDRVLETPAIGREHLQDSLIAAHALSPVTAPATASCPTLLPAT